MPSLKQPRKATFEQFLASFPEVPLPVILAEESHHIFAKKNDPLGATVIQQFLLPIEEEVDEYTEFVPCFRVPDTYDFHAIVYWKAGLMNYQYVLATFSKKAQLLDKKVIAGTFSDGKALTTSVATLDEDWLIYIASGQSVDGQFDPTASTAHTLELLPEGTIVKSGNTR